ncbi:helix-turn-helix domain-containing protein [Listeria cornellensis]|nr:helix-turn-helix domain-containing protein [Listeria cornellensis]
MREGNVGKVEILLKAIATWFGETTNYEGFTRIPRGFTRKVLANYMGISHTTLSTTLNELVHADLIFIQNQRLHILMN